jgi:dihydrodipicolinate synthase/N-acetylneuraminate lyase
MDDDLMHTEELTAESRALLLKRFFPRGIPGLWCPPLTHYTQEGVIDGARIAAHLRHLATHVKAFLIAGSTSDGWELSDKEFRELINIGLKQAQELDLYLLIGILKAEAFHAHHELLQLVKLIQSITGESDPQKALIKARVCGFTVCAPRGKQVSQDEMERGLVKILETGFPVALYQLPQVTENEMGAELLHSFSQRFSNFVFFKDSSGADRVVLSGKDLGGVFTMRGAEGNYLDWLKDSGRGYDGFLLSSANAFAKQLDAILSQVAVSQAAARKTSEQVSSIISETFDLVRGIRDGNSFANANKALDHFFAYGPGAEAIPGPRLHAGSKIPDDIIRKTADVLRRHGCMPMRGYLEGNH